tara:strand:- start:418 stop:846 length:429 start_codon:yes stop_codon:yes gene_type:complete
MHVTYYPPSFIGAFIVEGAPVAMGRPRFMKTGRAYTPTKTREAVNNISSHAQNIIRDRGIDTPIHLDVVFLHPRPKRLKKGPRVLKTTRPDLDNLIKTVKDGITEAGIWKDDSFVVKITALDFYSSSEESPKTMITIRGFNA